MTGGPHDAPGDAGLSDRDLELLRLTLSLADHAVGLGDRPYGAVFETADGELISDVNSVATDGDVTSHAELKLLRAISVRRPAVGYVGGTLYASTEPCVMCAGALLLCGVTRVVYALDEGTVRKLARTSGATLWPFAARRVLTESGADIQVIGPALPGEAVGAHERFWRSLS